MNPDSVAVLIPVAAIAAWAWVRTVKLKAAAHPPGADSETGERLQALEQEVGTLRHELSEAQERLDFAERLLAQRKQDGLKPPA